MKYSKNFERDWNWFNKFKQNFTFDGTHKRKVPIDEFKGKSAKECYHKFDSEGILIPTNEPELLKDILKCKGSINFQIKEWSKGRADGTLPRIEFENEIIPEFELLPWMIKAVEEQKFKHYNKKMI